MPTVMSRACALAAFLVANVVVSASAADRHAGYYYPPAHSNERYTGRVQTLPETNRRRRVGFITQMMNQLMESPFPPQFAVFAKGAEAEKVIISAVADGSYNTVYRMRALLAILTARARVTPIFRQYELEDVLTFLDLLKMLGFTQLTVTDGDRFSHQIFID
ncbi:MAG: molybdopterin-guanine dinucleotide biosynthesis protein A [Gammaproteobacteria bacterium]|nr:molybdopterin-guanine dinucleotide biosynthesis protein A [Gammaproteobacteria bacterium]